MINLMMFNPVDKFHNQNRIIKQIKVVKKFQFYKIILTMKIENKFKVN
jgi:hypothetical protein